MFLYLAPKKAGEKKKSQQARDREAAALEAKESQKQAQAQQKEVDTEMPANGGLFANAKISDEALKKLTEKEEE
jgi:translation initiation factor IF-3